MAASLIPELMSALVALAEENLDTSVHDGYRVGEKYPEDELLLGVDDAVSTDQSSAAQSTQEWAYTGSTERKETGTVTSIVMVYDSDGDQTAARDRAFEILTQFFAAIASDATVGVPGMQWVKPGDDLDYLADQDADGAVAALVFRLSFFGYVS